MKIFISARSYHREKTQSLYEELRRRGHTITFDWTLHENIKPYIDNPELSAKYSHQDIMGVFDCEVFILLTDEEVGTGVFTEFGAALMTSIVCDGEPKIYVVGEHNTRSMFFFHPNVKRIDSVEELLEELDKLKP